MKYNMPFGNANLTDKEVVDITLYVVAQPRDDFNLKDHLLPREKWGTIIQKYMRKNTVYVQIFLPWGLV